MADLNTYERRTAKILDANLARYEREAGLVLKDALNDIRGKMTVIYDRYAVDGELSLANMTQYNRLVKLETDILKTVDDATRQNIKMITRLRPDQYDEAFFRYAWTIDQAGGIRINWGQLNYKAIIASLDNRFYKLAIQTYTADAQVRILRELNSGLAQGKSYQQMARGLKDQINATQYQAMRIIRTEGQTAQTAGQDAAYSRAHDEGVDLDVIWDAALDTRTRDSHGRMDGTVRPENGLFKLEGETTPYPCWQGLSAGERINCRCRLRGNIADYSPSLRRIRGQGVQPYQTFDDWEKAAKGKVPKQKPTPKPRKTRGHITPQSIDDTNKLIAADMGVGIPTANDTRIAIQSFSQSDYRLIRLYQRNPSDMPKLPPELAKAKNQGELIENYVKQSPIFPDSQDIYRGVDNAYADVIKQMPKGAELSFGATSSFSSELEIARGFAGHEKVIIKLQGVKTDTTSIKHISKIAKESEVLVSKDNMYKVISSELTDIDSPFGPKRVHLVTVEQAGGIK